MSRLTEFLGECAPVVLRLAGGVIFSMHGYQKAIGGMEKFPGMIASIGLPPYFVYVGAFVELVGGMVLLLGLLVRVASLLLAGQMAVAIVKFHILYLKQGLMGGYELPLALLAMMLALFCLGSGPFSLDRKWFGWK